MNSSTAGSVNSSRKKRAGKRVSLGAAKTKNLPRKQQGRKGATNPPAEQATHEWMTRTPRTEEERIAYVEVVRADPDFELFRESEPYFVKPRGRPSFWTKLLSGGQPGTLIRQSLNDLDKQEAAAVEKETQRRDNEILARADEQECKPKGRRDVAKRANGDPVTPISATMASELLFPGRAIGIASSPSGSSEIDVLWADTIASMHEETAALELIAASAKIMQDAERAARAAMIMRMPPSADDEGWLRGFYAHREQWSVLDRAVADLIAPAATQDRLKQKRKEVRRELVAQAWDAKRAREPGDDNPRFRPAEAEDFRLYAAVDYEVPATPTFGELQRDLVRLRALRIRLFRLGFDNPYDYTRMMVVAATHLAAQAVREEERIRRREGRISKAAAEAGAVAKALERLVVKLSPADFPRRPIEVTWMDDLSADVFERHGPGDAILNRLRQAGGDLDKIAKDLPLIANDLSPAHGNTKVWQNAFAGVMVEAWKVLSDRPDESEKDSEDDKLNYLIGAAYAAITDQQLKSAWKFRIEEAIKARRRRRQLSPSPSVNEDDLREKIDASLATFRGSDDALIREDAFTFFIQYAGDERYAAEIRWQLLTELRSLESAQQELAHTRAELGVALSLLAQTRAS